MLVSFLSKSVRQLLPFLAFLSFCTKCCLNKEQSPPLVSNPEKEISIPHTVSLGPVNAKATQLHEKKKSLANH